MNTAGSVAYGWGALIVAAGVAFYFAKKDINARRLDQTYRGQRPTEKLDWQQRISTDAARDPVKANTPTAHKGSTVAEGLAKVQATGVDNTNSSAQSNPNRDQ